MCSVYYEPRTGRRQNAHTKEWVNSEEKQERADLAKQIDKAQEDLTRNAINFSSGNQANEYFEKQSKLLQENETASKAFNYWSNLGSPTINGLCRGRQYLEEDEIPIAQKARETMNKWISTQKLNDDIKVYRTMDLSVFNKHLDNGVYSDKGFTATSTLFSAVEGGAPYGQESCWLEILVPKGVGRGAYINEVSTFKDAEFEYLIQENSNFLLTDSKITSDGKKIYSLRLITND